MAYKHPQLLINSPSNCTPISYSQNASHTNPNAATPPDNLRNRYESMFKVNIFGSNVNQIAQKAIDGSCKLIGNVKPNLVKTWEQLNGTRLNPNQMIEYPDYVDDDGLRTNYTKQQTAKEHSNETFIMSQSSNHFYDSIDNESIITAHDDDEQIAMSLDFELKHGGEAMAEYMSIVEKKEELCWSIDSCK